MRRLTGAVAGGSGQERALRTAGKNIFGDGGVDCGDGGEAEVVKRMWHRPPPPLNLYNLENKRLNSYDLESIGVSCKTLYPLQLGAAAGAGAAVRGSMFCGKPLYLL
jgi:hypothetical protein